jgi:hypothetical protein
VLYEFVRNTDLDAKSYFADSVEKFNLNQFGGSVGGPIFKNKTFFFVDAEQKYQRHGIPFTGLVPSLAMRSGDFSADPFGNTLFGIGTTFTPVIANPNMVGASTDPTVYPNVYFQCDSTGILYLPCRWKPAQGANCNKIPANLIDPIGKAMLNIYPYESCQFRQLRLRLQLRQRASAHAERNQVRCPPGPYALRQGQSLRPFQLRPGLLVCARRRAWDLLKQTPSAAMRT